MRGTLVEITLNCLVIESNGIGYNILVPTENLTGLPEPGQEIKIYTHLLVREDSMRLFGFRQRSARDLFVKLLDLPGIGPQIALQIAGAISADEFMIAIERQDVPQLRRIKGVGEKKAKQIILALKGAKMNFAQDALPNSPAAITYDAVCALETMGLSTREAEDRVTAAIKVNPDATVEQLVTAALQGNSSN